MMNSGRVGRRFVAFVALLASTVLAAGCHHDNDPASNTTSTARASGSALKGAAYWNGSIIFNTLDGRTIALDAATGQEKWVTRLGDINKGETMTMAPLIAKGKVIVGNSGGEFGVRGWVVALDAGTGKLAWKAY